MKLEFHGHDERYVVEQSLMNLFPGEKTVYEPIAPGDTVLVTVSRGSATRTLPEFDGISFATLQEALTADGFSPVRVDEPSDDIEVGYVIRYQDHNAGDSLDYGSTVTVVVSTGPASGDAGTGDTAPAQ